MTENAKTRQNVYFEMAPKATTLLHTSFLITPMHSVCREEFFFVENKLTRTYLKWGREGGCEFSTIPPFEAPLYFHWTKLAHAQLGYGAYNIRP